LKNIDSKEPVLLTLWRILAKRSLFYLHCEEYWLK
jgi:hypothetical protein